MFHKLILLNITKELLNMLVLLYGPVYPPPFEIFSSLNILKKRLKDFYFSLYLEKLACCSR